MKPFLFNLAMASVLVFLPIKATLATVAVLVLGDFVTGVAAARKRKEAITSKGFQRTIIKLLAYEAVVMLGFLVQSNLTGELVPVVKILGGMIGLTELKSVLENIEELTGIPLIQLLVQKLTQMSS